MEHDDPVHRVDANDLIVSVNPAWTEFAQRNGAPDLPGRVLGTSLWDHLAGATVRDLSKVLVESVRSSGRPLGLPFRCDAPDMRRYLQMEMTPLGNSGVEFRSRLVRSEQRPPVTTPPEAEGRSLVSQCAWCKRYRCPDGWREIEAAATALGLFAMDELTISHGICEECHAEQRKQIALICN